MQVSPAGQGDDKATFLAEFRALRARAELEYGELAARAHYPSDVLKEAEVGPDLPGLPVLSAYVRACGGDVAEWEERWHRLAGPVSNSSGLPVRPAGTTPAAVAGARASVTFAAADAHDPERIKAALRADREREEQASRSRLDRADRRLSASAMDPRKTAAGPATMIANGSHHKKPWPDGFDTPSAQPPAASTPQPPLAPPSAPSAAAESGFDAFRAPSRWQESGAAEGWQAFDTTTASHTDTAAASAWSPAAEESPAWSASAEKSSAWSPPAKESSAWSPADEPPKRAAAEPPGAVWMEQARTTRPGTGVTGSQAGAARTAKPARASAPRSNHPGLLAVLVVMVLLGCLALLMFT